MEARKTERCEEMNRIHKFRAIVKDGRGPDSLQGKWHYGSLLLFGDGAASIVPIDTASDMEAIFNGEHDNMLPTLEVVPETVGEYTGRADWHGTEAYEGDYVTSEYFDGVGTITWIIGDNNSKQSDHMPFEFEQSIHNCGVYSRMLSECKENKQGYLWN